MDEQKAKVSPFKIMIPCSISGLSQFSDTELTHWIRGWVFIRKDCETPWKVYIVVIPQPYPQGTTAIHSVNDILDKENAQIFWELLYYTVWAITDTS